MLIQSTHFLKFLHMPRFCMFQFIVGLEKIKIKLGKKKDLMRFNNSILFHIMDS